MTTKYFAIALLVLAAPALASEPAPPAPPQICIPASRLQDISDWFRKAQLYDQMVAQEISKAWQEQLAKPAAAAQQAKPQFSPPVPASEKPKK